MNGDDDVQVVPTTTPLALLESQVSLSSSVLWESQRNFYKSAGVDAWRKGLVPNYITTNTWLATSYAKVVAAYILDLKLKQCNDNDVLYIIELGAGMGRFAYYFLQAWEDISSFDDETSTTRIFPRLCYIVTDVVQQNVEFCLSHKCMQKYLKRGMLDAAVIDSSFRNNDDYSLTLLHSSKVITPGIVKFPPVIFANYVFCVLEQDGFKVSSSSTLSEALVTTVDEKKPGIIGNSPHYNFTHAPIMTSVPKYTSHLSAFNIVLESYKKNLSPETSFLLPVGAANVLHQITSIFNNTDDRGDGRNAFVLVADKGYNYTEELNGNVGYPMTVDGSISFMTNLHALGQYVENTYGGIYLRSAETSVSQGSTSLATACYILSDRCNNFPNTRMAFKQNLGDFGPVDYFRIMTTELSENTTEMLVQQLISLWRLCHFDPQYFWHIRLLLLKASSSTSTNSEYNSIMSCLEKTMENYYCIGAQDLYFEAGRVSYGLMSYDKALHYYKKSLSEFGDDYTTLYNIALCYIEIGDTNEALKYLDLALLINPTYDLALEMKARINKK